MKKDRLMASRFELKYIIPDATALRVRDFVRQHLEMDEYGVGQPDYSYPVHSLYLDSDDLKIYWRTVNGDKNRYKLRVRYYSDHPKSPIFFEIKRRMNNIILKQRCGVRREAVPLLLSGQLPESKHLANPDPDQLVSIQRFLELMLEIDAKPLMHVAYEREAYVHPHNDEVRVTMDRHIRVQVNRTSHLSTKMDQPSPVSTITGGIVVLELKFTGRFPNWFRDLVRSFNVMQTGAAKFVEGSMMVGNLPLNAKDIIASVL